MMSTGSSRCSSVWWRRATPWWSSSNLDVIKCADHIIDLGPEGGDGGGTIVCTGTPEEVAACRSSFTGWYLKKLLER